MEVTWSHIHHRSESNERFWENAVQVLGKTVLTSHNTGETTVNGYSPAQFLALSVSCLCLAKLIFTNYYQLYRFQCGDWVAKVVAHKKNFLILGGRRQCNRTFDIPYLFE